MRARAAGYPQKYKSMKQLTNAGVGHVGWFCPDALSWNGVGDEPRPKSEIISVAELRGARFIGVIHRVRLAGLERVRGAKMEIKRPPARGDRGSFDYTVNIL